MVNQHQITQHRKQPLLQTRPLFVAKAVKRSSFAVVCLPPSQAWGPFYQYIFYQDPQLHLRARLCRTSERVVSNLHDSEQVLNYIYP
jgi:hypothetical protein